MSNTSEKEKSPQLIFRVYPEPSGKVLLLYEPLDQQVEVSPPINKQNLEKAQELLVEKCAEVLKAREEQLEGKDELTLSPQQKARLLVRKIFEPPPRPSFWTYVRRGFEAVFQTILAVFAVMMMISTVYKGVELSQDHLPEFLHWVVLAIYVFGLSLCVYLMANDEKRRKETKRIRYWFGPSGMLVLPSLTLVAAAAVFSSITLSLYKHGLVMLEPCTGRAVAAGSLTDFYMWHFMKLVPLVKINEVLKLGEPLCYTQKRVGLLILLFQALVVIPSINTVLYYWKNRNTPEARSYDYVYEPEWEPGKKEATN